MTLILEDESRFPELSCLTNYLSGDRVEYEILAELHADLFTRDTSPVEGYVSWRSTKEEVKMLRPTRFVVGATESRKGGAAAELCSSQTAL